MTMKRRFLMQAAPLALGWPATRAHASDLAIPDGHRLAFTALRNGSVIGSHVLVFTPDAAGVTIAIDVSFKVGIGPIVLFRYRMQSQERWHGGQFVGINSVTDHNGHILKLGARRDATGVAIDATGIAPYRAPPDALPMTHWNRAVMHQPIFNPETGVMMNETVRELGKTAPPDGIGQADHFILTGTSEIEDWYDGTLWVGLKAKAVDGSTILYRREAGNP